MNAEVDAESEQNRKDKRRDEVQIANDHERDAERPKRTHHEGQENTTRCANRKEKYGNQPKYAQYRHRYRLRDIGHDDVVFLFHIVETTAIFDDDFGAKRIRSERILNLIHALDFVLNGF